MAYGTQQSLFINKTGRKNERFELERNTRIVPLQKRYSKMIRFSAFVLSLIMTPTPPPSNLSFCFEISALFFFRDSAFRIHVH